MVFPYFLLVCLLLETVCRASALHVGVRGKPRSLFTAKRDHISGLENSWNLDYLVNVTMGGQLLQVLIDTGSSDFWVASTISTAFDTGVRSEITYALGEVSGNIKTTQLEFLGYTIPDQAYLEVTSSSNTPPVSGILGLGPNRSSRIHASLNYQPQGDTVLDRIFRQNASAPNFLTVLLGRSHDPTDKYPGNITVGEILPGLENVTSQSRVPVTTLQPSDASDQHWQALLDEEGIIGPDGQPIQVQTSVKGSQNPKQLTAIFNTGFSLAQVPQEVASAIYSGIPGASLQSVKGLGPIWVIPCDAEINIAFKFGGQTYPVHPLDTNSDDALTDPDGRVCLGAFQPISSASPYFDMTLGTSFLRNVYLLINCGDFVDGSVDTTADPYVQLLSITDPVAAHADFVNARLNHTSRIVSPTPPTPVYKVFNSNPQPTADSSQTSDDSDVKSAFLREKLPIIIVSSVGVALVLIGIIVVCCTRDRFSKRGQHNLANTYQSYQRLEAPVPLGNLNQVRGYHSGPTHPNSRGRR